MLVPLLCSLAFSAAAAPLCRAKFPSSAATWGNCSVQIGLPAASIQRFAPTFRTYLTNALNKSHGLEFETIPVGMNETASSISSPSVDLLLLDSHFYVCMMQKTEAVAVVSLVDFWQGVPLDSLAGVIFTAAGSAQDVRGAHIAAVSMTSLGGMLLQHATLLSTGLNIMTDAARIDFYGSESAIVFDVDRGGASLGFVRAGFIDGLVALGLVSWDQFSVIGEIQGSQFPFSRSTDATAESYLVAGKHVPASLRGLVGVALMNVDRTSVNTLLSSPAVAGAYQRWVLPLNSHGLLNKLTNIGLYDPSEMTCALSSDPYQSIFCPVGTVRLPKERALCPTCPPGNTCLCKPCVKLNDEDFLLRAIPIETPWPGGINNTALNLISFYSPRCNQMDLCYTGAIGQSLMWSLLDNIGMDNRKVIKAPLVNSVEIQLDSRNIFFPMLPTNISLDGFLTQLYTINTTILGTGVFTVGILINGARAPMSPVLTSHIETPLKLLSCEKGFQSNRTKGECEPCSPGSYSLGEYESCPLCESGFFQSEAGRSLCDPCPIGSASWSSGATICQTCPAGQSTRGKLGQKECSLCEPGSFADSNGSKRCNTCARGSFSAKDGATTCDICSGGQTTATVGSVSADLCLCDSGQYWTRALHCEPCPEEVTCSMGSVDPLRTTDGSTGSNSSGASLMVLTPGFFNFASDLYSIFRCSSEQQCPGGPLFMGEANCKNLRMGFLCLSCPSEYVKTDEEGCEPCTKSDTVVLVIIIVAGAICLPLFLYAGTRLPLTERPEMVMALTAMALLVAFLQGLASLAAVQIDWGTPFDKILFVVKLIAFDLNVIKVSCFSQVGAKELYILKMSTPLIIIGIIAIFSVACTKAKFYRFTFHGIVNTVGMILMVFFITLCLAVLAPFQCYKHPNGKFSVVTSPSILCDTRTNAYLAMLVTAALSTLVYLVGVATVVAYAVYVYPLAIMSDSVGFVHMFRFLFMRFRPEVYWFSVVLLTRNLALSVCPMVVPPEQGELVLVIIHACVIFSASISAWMQPWRAVLANSVDVVLQVSLLFILIIGLGRVPSKESAYMNSLAACIVSLFCVVTSGLVVVIKLIFLMRPRPKFLIFLSHHKAGGACAARYLKFYLARRLKQPIFYDSDDLGSLTRLFDAVKESRSVIIILSGETLCRPWCVGEIVTACLNRVPIQTVSVGQHQRDYIDKWLTLDNNGKKELFGKFEPLRAYGISIEDIDSSVKKALDMIPITIDLKSQASMDEQLNYVMLALNLQSFSMHLRSFNDEVVTTGEYLLISDPEDTECISSCKILKLIIQEKAQKQVVLDAVLNIVAFTKLLRSDAATYTCWVMSAKSFESAVQLARVTVFYKLRPGRHITPVVIGDSLMVPRDDFLRALPMPEGKHGDDVEALLSHHADMDLLFSEVTQAVLKVSNNASFILNIPNVNETVLTASIESLIGGLARSELTKKKAKKRHGDSSEVGPGESLRTFGSQYSRVESDKMGSQYSRVESEKMNSQHESQQRISARDSQAHSYVF